MTAKIDVRATVPELLAKQVATRGNHPAVIMDHETVTYAELERRSAKLARALLASGAGKSTKIALMAPDGIHWVTTFFACLRIGAQLTQVSTFCSPRELGHILRNSDAQFFIGVRSFLRHDYVKTLTTALPDLNRATANKLRLSNAPYLRAIWLDNSEGLGWAESIAALTDRADAPDAPDAALLAAVESEVVPSDDAMVIYTSGSTALPKAVMHTHGNMTRQAVELNRFFLITENERVMPLLPAFWIGGLMFVAQVLSAGATLIYPRSPDVNVVLDTIVQLDVTRINSFGDMLVKIREAAAERGLDMSKIIGLGQFRDQHGVPIPPHLQVNMLGMSETFASHSAERIDFRLPEDKARCSGRAVNGYERRVVDPETGKEVALDEVGELQVRGGSLMTGFYKTDRRDVFTPDGYYPTKDLVRLDADGYIYWIGRLGDMIKTKVANVSRLEVEAVLRELPGVSLPFVVGLPDPEFGQRLVAAVVPIKDATLTEEALKSALRTYLSSFKVPKQIIFLNEQEIPRTATGKVMLSELAELISSRIDARAPQT